MKCHDLKCSFIKNWKKWKRIQSRSPPINSSLKHLNTHRRRIIIKMSMENWWGSRERYRRHTSHLRNKREILSTILISSLLRLSVGSLNNSLMKGRSCKRMEMIFLKLSTKIPKISRGLSCFTGKKCWVANIKFMKNFMKCRKELGSVWSQHFYLSWMWLISSRVISKKCKENQSNKIHCFKNSKKGQRETLPQIKWTWLKS